MANSEEKDLMGIGQHCAFPECQQLDFLPFKCDCCKAVFCVDHRTYAAHQCAAAGSKEAQVFVCPLCARAVKVAAGGDADTAFDRHCRTECDPSNYDKVHRKKRCPAPGCREKLTTINSYTCKDCGATVCLKHRLGTDHKCPGRQATAAAAAQSRFAGLPQAFRGLFSSGTSSSSAGAAGGKKPAAAAAAAAKPRAAPAPKNGGGGSGGGSVAAQLQQYREQQRAAAAAGGDVIDLTGSSPARPAGGGGGAELCQQCGARFGTVQELIAHAEQAHMDGWASGQMAVGASRGGGGAGGGLERCPHCGRQFADAVALVSHVEREHRSSSRTSRENCVLC